MLLTRDRNGHFDKISQFHFLEMKVRFVSVLLSAKIYFILLYAPITLSLHHSLVYPKKAQSLKSPSRLV